MGRMESNQNFDHVLLIQNFFSGTCFDHSRPVQINLFDLKLGRFKKHVRSNLTCLHALIFFRIRSIPIHVSRKQP